MKKLMCLCLCTLLLSACTPVQQGPAKAALEASAQAPTQIPPSSTATDRPATFTPPPSPTASQTPLPPTATLKPTRTPWPSRTPVPTLSLADKTAGRESGVYLVGTQIAPGIWCPATPNSQCLWMVYYPGREDVRFGSGGACMNVSQVVEVVEWDPECGRWEFLRPERYMTPLDELPLSEEAQRTAKKPGEYRVGIHIAAGVWSVEGGYDCEWAVFNEKSVAIRSGSGSTTGLNVLPSAAWVRLGKLCKQMTFVHN